MVKSTIKAGRGEKIILEPRRKFDYTSDSNIFYDMIVVGAGVAGFSAAMYAGRLGLKVLVIGELQGGTITLTKSVENFPGFISIEGGELGRLIENHAKDYNIDILERRVNRIEIHRKEERRHFSVFSSEKKFLSKTLLIATGTKVRKLGVPGEKKFENKGVSYCALCDGPLFKGKVIGVVGGGDSAVKEALLLAEYGKKVYIICRGDAVRSEKQNRQELNKKEKGGIIEVITNTNVIEIKGTDVIKSVIFDKEYKGNREFELEGLFVYVGHIPLNQFAKDLGVKLDQKGEIIINKNSETNINGIYAAGDVTNSDWKQAIIGVAEGVKAAYYAYQYVNGSIFILPLQGKKNIVTKLNEVEKNV